MTPAPPSPRRRRRIRSQAELKRSAFRVGALTLLVIVVATYFGFAKHIPFTHGFRVKAVFASATSIRKNSPVRIAGVNVGKVTGVERAPGTDAAIVTMELSQEALPLHRDATFKIRPRIFLEGNFFVDVSPGTPAAPIVHDDDTLPITQTAYPVQFDQVLTALQADTRRQLQDVLTQYGRALTYQPTAADNVGQDPIVAGLSAAQALNRSLRYSASGFKDSAIVTQSLLGTQPHDVSGLVAGLGKVTGALDRSEAQLGDLLVNLNTTMAAFASQAGNVRTTVGLLAPTLRHAHAALTDLNRSFPPTRALAREILPGVRETPATINAAFPWIAQVRALLGPMELRGLALQLQPAIGDLAGVIDSSTTLLPQTDLTAKCLSRVILPTGNIHIQDGQLSSGVENYKEFWYTMVGLAGESQNFDGNGEYVRFQPGGGDQTVSTGPLGGSAANALFGNAAAKPLGTRPAYPGHRPPYRPTVDCFTQSVPDLSAPANGPPDANVPIASARTARARTARAASARRGAR